MTVVRRKKPLVVALTAATPRELEDGEILRGQTWLKQLAEVIYVTDKMGISLDDLAADPRFQGTISRMQIGRWAAEGLWVDKRRQFFDGLTATLKKRMGSALVQQQLRQMQSVEKIAADMEGQLSRSFLPVKSYESFANTYLNVLTYLDNARRAIAAEVMPGPGDHEHPALRGGPVEVTDQEAYAAATAILELRKKAAQAAAEKPEEKKPDGPPVE